MHLMPSDDLIAGPIGYIAGVLAEGLAEDYLAQKVDPKELVKEVEDLLNAVDMAISQGNSDSDPDWKKMKTGWAFLGPGLFRRLEAYKAISKLSAPLVTTMREFYIGTAFIQSILQIRRQSLELNDVVVFK